MKKTKTIIIEGKGSGSIDEMLAQIKKDILENIPELAEDESDEALIAETDANVKRLMHHILAEKYCKVKALGMPEKDFDAIVKKYADEEKDVMKLSLDDMIKKMTEWQAEEEAEDDDDEDD